MDVKKLLKILPTGWPEEADAMDEQALRDVIVSSENNIRNVTDEMKENVDYQALREQLKEVAGPFRDAVKTQRAKIQYALLLLEQKGRL